MPSSTHGGKATSRTRGRHTPSGGRQPRRREERKVPRAPSGSIVVNRGSRGTPYAARFRAYGSRRYVTLDAATPAEAEQQLANILADVRRGIWRPTEPAPIVEAPAEEPTFHRFASEWVAAREAEGL